MRMLRTEIGEISNRGAWANAALATPEVIDLYKAPLKLEGADAAIMEVQDVQAVRAIPISCCENVRTNVHSGCKCDDYRGCGIHSDWAGLDATWL